MSAIEAAIYGASAVVCAFVALAALRSCLAEVAAWREGRWRSADIEAVRAEVRALSSELASLPQRLLKAEQTVETLKTKAGWKS